MSREKNTGIAPDIAMSAPFPGQLASGTRPERDRHGDPRGSCAPAARKNTAMPDERHRSTTYSFRTHPHEVSVDVVLTSGHLRVHPSQISNKILRKMLKPSCFPCMIILRLFMLQILSTPFVMELPMSSIFPPEHHICFGAVLATLPRCCLNSAAKSTQR